MITFCAANIRKDFMACSFLSQKNAFYMQQAPLTIVSGACQSMICYEIILPQQPVRRLAGTDYQYITANMGNIWETL